MPMPPPPPPAILWPAEATVHPLSTIGSEKSTSGAGNKMVRVGNLLHVVYQDADDEGRYLNRVRTLDMSTDLWSAPVDLNIGKDNHSRPIIAADGAGILHVVLGGHNSPITYRRSLRPNDSSAWSEAEPAGDGTYPVMVADADGVLYLTMRATKQWDGVDLYIKPVGKPWAFSKKLLYRDRQYPAYAGYQTALSIGPDGRTLHFLTDVYESIDTWKDRGRYQAVAYMVSHDGATTWTKADGTPVTLPARPEQMDAIAQDTRKRHESLAPPSILAQGSLVVPSDGVPIVMYVNHLDAPGQLILARPDTAGQWQQRVVEELITAFPEHRPVQIRASVTIDRQDRITCLMELYPLNDEDWLDGKPTRAQRFRNDRDKRLVWLRSTDLGKSFTVQQALATGTTFHEHNIARPTGTNIDSGDSYPPIYFFQGESRYREKDEVLQNPTFLILQ